MLPHTPSARGGASSPGIALFILTRTSTRARANLPQIKHSWFAMLTLLTASGLNFPCATRSLLAARKNTATIESPTGHEVHTYICAEGSCLYLGAPANPCPFLGTCINNSIFVRGRAFGAEIIRVLFSNCCTLRPMANGGHSHLNSNSTICKVRTSRCRPCGEAAAGNILGIDMRDLDTNISLVPPTRSATH